MNSELRLNPFRTGRCLSTLLLVLVLLNHGRLNPFRTGRCLSTRSRNRSGSEKSVSIPFEQGDVFRLHARACTGMVSMSQSLSNRAMSFDETKTVNTTDSDWSQSLSNRAMFFDGGVISLSEPYTRLNPFRTGRCFSTRP